MDGLPPIPLEGIGVVTLVVLFAIALASNRLYTRGQVRAIQDAHAEQMQWLKDATAREVEDANHERNEWRTEARLEHQTVVELAEQNNAMLTAFGPTLTDFLENMRQLASKRRGEERESA